MKPAINKHLLYLALLLAAGCQAAPGFGTRMPDAPKLQFNVALQRDDAQRLIAVCTVVNAGPEPILISDNWHLGWTYSGDPKPDVLPGGFGGAVPLREPRERRFVLLEPRRRINDASGLARSDGCSSQNVCVLSGSDVASLGPGELTVTGRVGVLIASSPENPGSLRQVPLGGRARYDPSSAAE